MKSKTNGMCLAHIAAFLLILQSIAFGDPQGMLTRHVREATRNGEAQPLGRLPADRAMNLNVVLPIRDQAGLDRFLKEVYSPGQPTYRHYLTVAEFTRRFGPSQADYDTVVQFAKSHGFAVTGGSRDGMDVQIEGPVSAVESAFHVTMRTYRHPTEDRVFYAPDREPAADLPFQLWHISGLDNYSIPHPMLSKKSEYAKAHGLSEAELVNHDITGSGPSSSFLGSDMRAAYYGSGPLTGSGQTLGLFEFAGTDLNDLVTYYTNIGQTFPVPVTVYSTDGTSTGCFYPACDDGEQTLDMTQAMGMAPGLAGLVMFVGSTDTAILSHMTTYSPLPMTISSSWGWTPADPSTLDPYFQKLAAQGQSYFQCSFDSSTWSSSNNDWPADNQYVVTVGGTDLVTTGPGGAWKSETAWSASGGGISPNKVAIPAWQHLSGVINPGNKGSITLRNGPDVSANGNWSFYVCADQMPCTANVVGGTSFAAPMWAAYMALVNEQLAASGQPSIGFPNPLIYAQNTVEMIGQSTPYHTNFHDITSGKSGSFGSKDGYDLVTGWGSPNAGLLNALAPQPLLVSIWGYTGEPCSGSSCPGWQMLDNNPATTAIAASESNLYELHSNGQIWKSTGEACVNNTCPGWTMYDNNPLAVAIVADGNNLYELHSTGSVWKSTGVACTGNSCPGWTMYDNTSATINIAASNGNLYELHYSGLIFKSTGAPCNGNSCSAGWTMIDNNATAVAIAADGNNLYQLHSSGGIYKWNGTPCSGSSCPGWTQVDNNKAAIAIAAANGNLYELLNNGHIGKWPGTTCSNGSCPGWTLIDNNPLGAAIVAWGNNLYELHSNGQIFSWTGQACSGSSCPGWTMWDDNSLTTQIVGAFGLYQLHGRR